MTRDLPESDPDLDDLLARAYRYAYSLTHQEAQAADLLQEACLAVVQAGGSWNRAYLFTAIRSRFYNQLRRARLVLIESHEDMDAVVDEEGPGLLGDREELHLESEELEQALGELAPEQREALYLAAVEGYTAQEIADHTDRPRGTILSWIHRAKNRIRKRLGREEAASR